MDNPQKRIVPWWRMVALATAVLGGLSLYAHHFGRHPEEPSTTAEAAAPTPSPPPGMDDAQREYLWNIEHHGLVLSRHGFRRVADALRLADRQALTALFSPDFQGQVVRQSREVRTAGDFVSVVRWEDAGQPPLLLSREQFCERLLEYRQFVADKANVHLALMGLSPAERGKVDGPWQGTCQLRIWGEAAPGQPGEVVLDLRYEVSRPTEQTLRQPGWLRACALTQSQTARAPRFLFREVAAERGIDRRRFHDNWEQGMKGTVTGGVYLCDYNRDGILDMLVVDLNCCALYRGLPDGKFTDVTREVGLPWRLLDPTGANLVAAFVDLDGDGWEDLILDRRIYRNMGGQRFQDVSHLSNLRLRGDVSGIAVADYDRDGRLDLYVTRLTPSKTSSWLDGKGDGRGSNLLFRNRGNWQFEEVAAASGATGGDRSTFSAVWFDANDDGWPDLYVINEFGSGVLLVNQGDGTFRECALTQGSGDFGSMGVTAGDVDNDGHIDLYVANMYSKAGSRVIGNVRPGTYVEDVMAKMRSFVTGSQLHRNRGNLRFEQRGQDLKVAAVGWAYGPALVDLDNDGWLDLYATAGFVSQDRNQPDG